MKLSLLTKFSIFVFCVVLVASYGIAHYAAENMIRSYLNSRKAFYLPLVGCQKDKLQLPNSTDKFAKDETNLKQCLNLITSYYPVKAIEINFGKNGEIRKTYEAGVGLDREIGSLKFPRTKKLNLFLTFNNTEGNFRDNKLYVPEDKIYKFLNRAEDVALTIVVPVKRNEKVLGQIIFLESLADIARELKELQIKFISYTFILEIIVVIFTLLFINRQLLVPFQCISGVIKKASEYDFSHKFEFTSGDEIETTLGRDINAMMNSLDKKYKELEEQNQGLAKLSTELETENRELKDAKKMFEMDLTLAHTIQQEMLPQKYPKINGLQISSAIIPLTQVGGDCYDFYKLSDTKLGTFIGDVSGKGISAALVVSMATILFGQLKDEYNSPAVILGKVNDVIFKHFSSQHSMYLTCFFIILDLETMTLTFANAGHNPPILLRAAEPSLISLDSEGFGLGMFSNVTYEEKTISIVKGDKIILYTDGVTDSRNPEGAMFGYERLEQEVLANPRANCFQLTHILFDAVEEFAEASPRVDDFTLVVIEVENKQK